MLIAKETKLKDFDFWGGAKWFCELLTNEELNTLEEIIKEYFESFDRIPTNTDLNDFVLMNTTYISQVICGCSDEEELLEQRWKQTKIEL